MSVLKSKALVGLLNSAGFLAPLVGYKMSVLRGILARLKALGTRAFDL